MSYIVVCRDGATDDAPGTYVLATRTVFTERDTAALYACGISASREALIVEGRFDELHLDNAPMTASQMKSAQDRIKDIGTIIAARTGALGREGARQLAIADKKISTATANGDRIARDVGPLNEWAHAELKRLGYKVVKDTANSGPCGSVWNVTW